MKRWRDQRGQSLVEFALVLPLLLVLTLGTLSIYVLFAHKSTMTGVAFMSARAAAVRNPHFSDPRHKDYQLSEDLSRLTLKSFGEKSGLLWVREGLSRETLQGRFIDPESVKMPSVKAEIRQKGGLTEIFTNLLTIIAGRSQNGPPQDLVTHAMMQREFFDLDRRSPTRLSVTYQHEWGVPEPVKRIIDPITETFPGVMQQMADPRKKEDGLPENEGHNQALLTTRPSEEKVEEFVKGKMGMNMTAKERFYAGHPTPMERDESIVGVNPTKRLVLLKEAGRVIETPGGRQLLEQMRGPLVVFQPVIDVFAGSVRGKLDELSRAIEANKRSSFKP